MKKEYRLTPKEDKELGEYADKSSERTIKYAGRIAKLIQEE